MEVVEVRQIKTEIKQRLSRVDFSLCNACGACASGCPIPGAPGMEGWDPRVALRMIALGLIDEVVESDFPWVCSGCGRCVHACPMGIDLVFFWEMLKSLRDPGKAPGAVARGVLSALPGAECPAVPREDYLLALADAEHELAEDDLPGFSVPVDKKDAEVMFFPNVREVFGDSENMKWWWRIFYAARENWTAPSEDWESAGRDPFSDGVGEGAASGRPRTDFMRDLRAGRTILLDCVRESDDAADYYHLYEYLKNLLETGRIKVDPSKNAGRVFTWHDSCRHGRELERRLGRGVYEEPRWILARCVGRENVVELTPNRANNFCCGAGGGNWPMPFERQSAANGRFKVEQIERSGADVVVVGCSNCRDQIMKRLPKYYPGMRRYEVKYIWQLVAESLVIEPMEGEELAAAQAAAKAQWGALGVDLYAG